MALFNNEQIRASMSGCKHDVSVLLQRFDPVSKQYNGYQRIPRSMLKSVSVSHSYGGGKLAIGCSDALSVTVVAARECLPSWFFDDPCVLLDVTTRPEGSVGASYVFGMHCKVDVQSVELGDYDVTMTGYDDPYWMTEDGPIIYDGATQLWRIRDRINSAVGGGPFGIEGDIGSSFLSIDEFEDIKKNNEYVSMAMILCDGDMRTKLSHFSSLVAANIGTDGWNHQYKAKRGDGPFYVSPKNYASGSFKFYGGSQLPYTGVGVTYKVIGDEDDRTYIKSVSDSDGLVMMLDPAMFNNGEEIEEDKEPSLKRDVDGVADRCRRAGIIGADCYCPKFSLEMRSGEWIEPMDFLDVEDIDGTVHRVRAMSVSKSWSGGEWTTSLSADQPEEETLGEYHASASGTSSTVSERVSAIERRMTDCLLVSDADYEWEIEKSSSGVMRAYATMEVGAGTMSQYGALWYSEISVDMPSGMREAPFALAAAKTGIGLWEAQYIGGSNGSLSFYLISATDMSGSGIELCVMVRGSWK